MPRQTKIGYCQKCGKVVGFVPLDATEITCFKCNEASK